jgi:hypothetical protein
MFYLKSSKIRFKIRLKPGFARPIHCLRADVELGFKVYWPLLAPLVIINT